MLARACDLACRGAAMGRADRGLFHGKTKQYGNKISFSHHASRRSWTPNTFHKKLYSNLLDVTLKVPLSSKALRCIDKAGSLDNYILTTHPEELASKAAMELRSLLVPKWEALNGRPYDRRQLVYETRLTQRVLKGRVTSDDAQSLIDKSRVHLAQRRGISVSTSAETSEDLNASSAPSATVSHAAPSL